MNERLAEIEAVVESRGELAGDSLRWLLSLVRDLGHQLEESRETATRLNRRCQEAEAVANENVEKVARAGMSFGRGLANYAASMYERERDEAVRERDAARAALQAIADRSAHLGGREIPGYELARAALSVPAVPPKED